MIGQRHPSTTGIRDLASGDSPTNFSGNCRADLKATLRKLNPHVHSPKAQTLAGSSGVAGLQVCNSQVNAELVHSHVRYVLFFAPGSVLRLTYIRRTFDMHQERPGDHRSLPFFAPAAPPLSRFCRRCCKRMHRQNPPEARTSTATQADPVGVQGRPAEIMGLQLKGVDSELRDSFLACERCADGVICNHHMRPHSSTFKCTSLTRPWHVD